jgi:hypothetical protein
VWVEITLVRSGKFSLLGKKALMGEEANVEVVLVDVTECPVERPKKTRKDATVGKRSVTPKKRG